MKMYQITLHSVVDVITNSSTTIYTYSEGSVKPAKELINEFFKMVGVNKTVDDVFYIGAIEDAGRMSEIISEKIADKSISEEYINHPEMVAYSKLEGWPEREKFISEIFKDYVMDKREYPKWLSDNIWLGWSEMEPESMIHIIPKDEKYKELAEKLVKFLYSTQNEAVSDT